METAAAAAPRGVAARAPGDAPAEEERCSVYDERCRRFGAERERHAARSKRLSNMRLAAFIGALAAGVWAESVAPGERAVPVLLALGLAAVFLLLLSRYRRSEALRRRFAGLHDLNAEGRARIRREWDQLPPPWFGTPPPDHPYAEDLDLAGPTSVAQLLGPVGTPAGRSTLRDWLLAPAPPSMVPDRQSAIRELADGPDLRDELALQARLTAEAGADSLDRVIEWAEDEPWLARRRLVVWTSRVLPVLTVGLAILHLVGGQGYLWLLPLGAGLTMTWRLGPRIHEAFGRAFPRVGVFRRYPRLFGIAEAAAFRASMLERLQAQLRDGDEGGVSARRGMQRLERIMELADLRFSRLLHFPVHAITLWDFHVLRALERWQARSGRRLRGWLRALGELEALSALAALAHDHPDWVYPTLEREGAALFGAEALGHPLLPGRERVVNDVTVGPPGTYLLVTGSNMSGKSTLLRAIGVNAVLAQAGAPVCAAQLRLPPVTLFTSMRVQDSLAAGVSYFMAGLLRLKAVVEAASAARDEERTLLYLLDEILQGTNTAERLAASRRIIRHLVDEGAIGAVTTHDLALAEAEELAEACRPVHFREQVRPVERGMEMAFDYRLRPGVATSTNALRLMELVGLDV